MFKTLRRLSGKGYRRRKDFFKIRLFGRKALSFIYGNLSLRNFKHLYAQARLNRFTSFYTSFFFHLVGRADVFLSVLRFVPSVGIGRECVKQGLVFVSGPEYQLHQAHRLHNHNFYLKPLQAIHFHQYQGSMLFVLEFYQTVVRRPFFFYSAVAEIS